MKRKAVHLILIPLIVIAGTRSYAAGPAAVNLGTAGNFAVLAGSTVTNTGPSTITGDLGLSPGSSVTGFPPGMVSGGQHIADAVAVQAQSDLTTAYNDAAGRSPATLIATELGGSTLLSGIYKAGTFQVTGTLTLDAQGDPSAVWILQSSSTLITASNSSVVLINGAQPCNVLWQVTSSATLGTNSIFKGNILALTSVTLNTGAKVEGRILARNGAVTVDSGVTAKTTCAAPVPSSSSSSLSSFSSSSNSSLSSSKSFSSSSTATFSSSSSSSSLSSSSITSSYSSSLFSSSSAAGNFPSSPPSSSPLPIPAPVVPEKSPPVLMPVTGYNTPLHIVIPLGIFAAALSAFATRRLMLSVANRNS